MLASLGASAFALAKRDPSQKEESTLVYRSEGQCIDDKVRTPEECRAAYREASAAGLTKAPRYVERRDCERHHGSDQCEPHAFPGSGYTSSYFVPRLSAFMMGRSAAQNLPVQPLYRHREEGAAPSSGGSASYCSSGGGRIWTSTSGATSAKVSTAVARETTSSPRIVPAGGSGVSIARSGFGSTGHALSGGHASGGS
jgi:uncharacterized protein YgiB involved in biofilm formation